MIPDMTARTFVVIEGGAKLALVCNCKPIVHCGIPGFSDCSCCTWSACVGSSSLETSKNLCCLLSSPGHQHVCACYYLRPCILCRHFTTSLHFIQNLVIVLHTWYNSSVALYIAEVFFVCPTLKTVTANMIAVFFQFNSIQFRFYRQGQWQ